ncbi:hypothetical protein QTP88_001529 [Uroleucon formosanum]
MFLTNMDKRKGIVKQQFESKRRLLLLKLKLREEHIQNFKKQRKNEQIIKIAKNKEKLDRIKLRITELKDLEFYRTLELRNKRKNRDRKTTENIGNFKLSTFSIKQVKELNQYWAKYDNQIRTMEINKSLIERCVENIHSSVEEQNAIDEIDSHGNGGTVGLWRLLTHTSKSEFYTDNDFKIYKQILIETGSIYQNNDKSTGRAKSSGGAKYVAMIGKIWKEINENKKTKGGVLKKYIEDRIEYHYSSNVKQLTERLQFISAEERAGNNNFHNEKLGILHLFKTIMEKIIDTPEGIEYLVKYVTCLPKEVKISKDSIINKIYFMTNEERK